MSILEEYFRHQADETHDHPVLRLVDEAERRPDVARMMVEVLRPRDVLGFKAVTFRLHLLDEAGRDIQACHTEDWDDALNAALVKRRIRAISTDNEKVRFALGLRAALQVPETRFGDGYFNAVLVHHIESSPFAHHAAVVPVLKHVYRSGIDPSFRTYAECRHMIDAAIRGRALELVESLQYDRSTAEEILAAAVAQYLDERFSVTNRRMMGLL
jgi:hypothetical protein